MPNLFKIREELLSDGKITVNEVEKIKDAMAADGKLDFQDAMLLVELMKVRGKFAVSLTICFFPACARSFCRTVVLAWMSNSFCCRCCTPMAKSGNANGGF